MVTDAAEAANSNPVPLASGIVGTAESAARPSEPHAVNSAPAIPPATTDELPPPPPSVPIPPRMA